MLLGGIALSVLAALFGGRFSEAFTARLLLAGIVVCIAAVALRWRRLVRLTSLEGLCAAYQRACPEDRNALDAAVELESLAEHQTHLQAEYLRELHERYLADGGAALRDSRALRQPWRFHAIALAVAMLCIGCYVGRAAWWRLWKYVFGNEAVAICALPKSVAVHSDLAVKATIVRYGGDTVMLESVIDGVHRLEKMSPDGAGEWRLVLYDMTEEARFRALTKYGASKWRRVGCHIPPAPESISVDVIPPEYTGLENRHYDEFQDMEILAGSRIVAECQMPQGQRWELLDEDGGVVPSLSARKGIYTPRYVNGEIISEGNPFRIDIIPDEVPIIEMVSPEEDSQIAPEQESRVVAMVSDDFGVSEVSLHYIVDDGNERRVSLEKAVAGANVSIDTPVTFGELEAGQVVTGWLEAKDNCVPEVHVARGPLFFMAVIPAKDDSGEEAAGKSDDESAKRQEMSVSDLITETKRLLRETTDLIERERILDGNAIQQSRQALSRELRSLSSSVTGRQVAVAKNAGVAELPKELADFFKGASDALNVAGDMVEQGGVDESRKPQQKALSQLTRLAWLLMQNAQAMSKGSDGGESQNDGQKKQGGQESKTQKGDRNFDIDELQNALEQVRLFRKRQQELLRNLNAANAIDERALADAVNGVATKVAAIASAARAVPPLRDASRELMAAGTALDGADVPNAVLRGQRAEIALGVAEDLLDDALQKESRDQLERLAEKADELAKEQRALAEQSREYGEKGASADERRAAKDAQKELERRSQSFKDETVASLRSLSRQYPDASGALAEALKSSISEQLQKAQTRANNALLYGRFDRAQESQKQAAEALEQWRDELSSANDALPRFTPEELQQALEEIQQRAQALAQAMDGAEIKARQDAAAQALLEYAERFRSEELNALGSSVAQGTRDEALAAMQAARTFLREELARLMGSGVMNAVRQSAPPPKKYRPQTQEYFRRLGNGGQD